MERGIRLPQSPSEWGFKGENYLLVIGIDKYQHWKPLHNAVKDVRDITRLLTERYQFEADHVMTLFDEDATEDNIRQKLLEIKRTITKEDNLIVFYSGHGFYDADLDEGYWVPANARKDHPSDYISNSDVLKWIRSIKTHHTLILVDSCFSGTLVSQSRSEVLSEKYPSCRIFASGRKELVDDGVPGTNSPFAKAILSRLSYNTDRVMRASELIHNVTKAVESQAGQAPVEGRIKDAGDEGGEFVFHLKVTEEEIWNAVVHANTPEEYSKYIEYYPDGKHVLAARTKLSQLTDENDWNRATELSTVASFMQYLEVHPQGAHNDEAIRRLEDIEENDAWQKAKTRNTASSFMDYLRKYPSGKFEKIARLSLDQLKDGLKQTEQNFVRDELENIAGTTVQSKDNKDHYKSLISEAESLFAQMSYDRSITKYEQALQVIEPHFVPPKSFVIQRIDLAKKRIKYSEFLSDGDNALNSGNYDLALEYYKKAQSFDNTVQVQEKINLANRRGAVVIPPPTPVFKKKKRRPVATFLWLLGIMIVGIIGLVIYQIASEFEEANDYWSSVDEPVLTEATPVTPIEYTTSEPGPTIFGTWNVSDRIISGASILGSHDPATYTFYNNGSVVCNIKGVEYPGSWNYSAGVLYTTYPSLGNLNGYIAELGNNRMVWVTDEIILGVQVQVTNYLDRLQ